MFAKIKDSEGCIKIDFYKSDMRDYLRISVTFFFCGAGDGVHCGQALNH
jgi:hypothetical protein